MFLDLHHKMMVWLEMIFQHLLVFRNLIKLYLENESSKSYKKALGKKKSGKIKQVLMSPEVIAGIGNIYASEILWQAKVHPEKSVAKLSEKELELIYQAIKKILEIAIKLGGDSFSDYRKPDGTKGSFNSKRKVYKREGENCSHCKTKIKRIHLAGRSTFFCPNCQKL